MKSHIKVYSFCALVALSLALVPPKHRRGPRKLEHNRPPHQIDSRISDGTEMSPLNAPWQAGLFIRLPTTTYFCSGALVSHTTVLTSAQCILSTDIEVVLGANRVFEFEEFQIRMTASEVIVHPDFNTDTLHNDIAIIRLPEEVEPTEEIHKANVPTRFDSFLFDPLLTTGWGATEDFGNLSETLQGAREMYAYDDIAECERFYTLPLDNDTQFCFYGGYDESICNGDNGDPMYSNDLHFLSGLASYFSAYGCLISYPQIGTRIYPYLDWIGNNSDVVIVDGPIRYEH